MITQNEISSLNLSPTKKDFVQIWNELIEVASKITERWDPTSTNESDPGIVLLKVLAGIADKLNYNIDKNILEAYMPTAAQMESMRKLCELVGYDIKYYQSAETKVRISYTGNTTDLSTDNDEKLPTTGLALPKFTTITNADKDITFVTTNTLPVLFTNTTPWVEVPCIEGQISQCESINESNLITASQLDANNRYYLPEIQIAENGIFVYSAKANLTDGDSWTQVTNLNTQPAGNRIYKFGYDSIEGRPYLAFPADIGNLIGDGLFIYFVRTSGLNGNISHHTLEVLELPTGDDWKNYAAEQFEVVNTDSTTNGSNIESISDAYNNFKKTVGTFDTLVTCRDYMNKIYSLMDASNSPYVSNILVTDIRNDINNAITLCSCNEFGILYKETPLTKTVLEASSIANKKVDDGNGNLVNKLFIEQYAEKEVPLIDHFDLILYPFKTFTQVSAGVTKLAVPYNESFTYTELMNKEIEASIEDFKTCAHKLATPEEGDIVAINNYLRLDAFIATSMRVSEVEAKDILHNVKVALVNAFNLRNLDFGEEIPFDSILTVIEDADPRIKVVSLQEPTVLTTYSVKERVGDTITSKEYGIASTAEKDRIKGVGVSYDEKDTTAKGETAKDIYNKLVLRNILAGRASLFDYDETFIANNSEKPYTLTKDIIDEITTHPNYSELQQAIENAENRLLDKALVSFTKVISETTPVGYTENYTYDTLLPGFTGFDNGPLTFMCEVQAKKVDAADEDTQVETAIVSRHVYETYEHNFIKDVPATFARGRSAASPATGEIINDIARVEAACEITSSTNTFKNITLGKNEVIKFRAPNLITTKTFPAYVYYRFERDGVATQYSTGAPGGTDGSYADVISLVSFINDIGKQKFFSELWNEAAIKSTLETFDAKIIIQKLNGELVIVPDSTGINQSGKVKDVFSTAIACGTVDNKTNETVVFTSESEFLTYLDKKREELFESLPEGGMTEQTLVFKYYQLKAGTIEFWSLFIRGLYKELYSKSLPDGTTLWKLASTGSHPRGKLVTTSGQKLYPQDGDTLLYGNVGESTYICTELGSDPIFNSISSQSDVKLGSNERLFIHYTPSSTNEDGETVDAEPISIVFDGSDTDNPVIIKPSGFELTPSDEVVSQQSISWKKQGVEFAGYGPRNLLALAPNEQIELRSISKVVLDSPAKLYKNFDNEELERGSSNKIITYELKDGEYLFYTDQNTQEAAYYGSGSVITLDKEAYIPKATKLIEVSQILEEGLRVVPWSYEVPLSANRKITITEYQYTTLVEGDTLNTLTVDSAKGLTADGKYTIGSTRVTTDSNGQLVAAPWVPCEAKSIIYTPANEQQAIELPRIDLAAGADPGIGSGWEVCSFLELSTSPGYSQTLRAAAIPQSAPSEGLSDTVTITNKLSVYLDEHTGVSEPIVIEPQKTARFDSGSNLNSDAFEPVSFKLNTIAQAASGNFNKPEDDSEEESETTTLEKLQMKVFSEETPLLLELDNLDTEVTPISTKYLQSDSVKFTNSVKPTNINNYWSALDLSEKLTSEGKVRPNALSLNFMIPDPDLFGVFSIYLETSLDRLDSASNQNMLNAGSRVFIDIPKEFGTYDEVITIYNYQHTTNETTHYWWPEGIDPDRPNRLYLRAGLNCIKVSKSCNILVKAEKSANGTIIYDNLRLVKGRDKQGINLSLLDFKVADDSATDKQKAEALLNAITTLDKKHEFYYNAPIENSLAIEFNENISSFANPYTLYDVNNINNNFVVSKLDIKYLDTGLQIAKSSKF
jgi:hypothetical protein